MEGVLGGAMNKPTVRAFSRAKGYTMEIKAIFSFLVPPAKNPAVELYGTALPLTGNLFTMLSYVFEHSDSECKIPIRFISPDGRQHNDARSELIAILENPSIETAHPLALRLHNVTTRTSGLGLLFLIVGAHEANRKIVVSRFPASQGVLAEPRPDTLKVDFLEHVFMKGAGSYKAVCYVGSSFAVDFWDGAAVDKQLANAGHSMAEYWIRDFLLSDFASTPKAGSKRLGVALRDAAKAASTLDIKQEIVSLATLIPRLGDRPVSINSLFDHFNVSAQARDAIQSKLPNGQVNGYMFRLDVDEFNKHVALRSTQLDNGAILTAPAERFEECFKCELVDESERKYRYSAEGRIVDERVRSTR